jgi:tetratricopeptide (TPR) repeat protein
LAYDRKHLFDLAIADYDEAIRLAPNRASAYLKRARAFLAKGDLDKVFADLSEAIRLEPGNPRAYEIRAEAHDFLGDADAAEADRRKVTELKGEEYGDSRHAGED